MTKSYFTTAALLLASALSASAAQGESDFISAKEQAIARLTSWSEASPYAPEALAAGIADLNSITFSAYSDGDIAVKSLNDLYDQIITSAREELKDNIYRIFVSLTTDALTESPINGGTLIGSEEELTSVYNVSFKVHSQRNQFSTWIFNIVTDRDGRYCLRNNNGNYVVFPEPDSETINMSRYPSQVGPFVSVEFADNGKMMVKYGEKYLATNADGQLFLSTTFGPEASWTIKRAVDSKFDKPIISSKENPVYYIIRNANNPRKGLTPTEHGRFATLAGVNDGNQWYFVDCGRRNGSFYAYSKNGFFLGSSNTGHMYAFTSGIPGPIYSYLRDGSDDIGMCLTMRSEGAYAYADNNPGIIYYTENADGYYASINAIKNSFHDWSSNPGIFSWYFELADGSIFNDFIKAKEEYTASLKQYLSSQPWGKSYINSALDRLDIIDLGDYEDVDAASNAMAAIVKETEAALPAIMVNEATEFFANKGRVALYNTRRSIDKANPTSPLSAIANDLKTNFNTLDISPDSASVWEFEPIAGKTESFRIKTVSGKYLGSLKANSPVEGVNQSNAAEFKLSVRDGYVVITNSTGRSAMYMNETDGSLTAGQPTNDGSLWIIKRTVLINSGNNAPIVSTPDNIRYYVIRSVSDTTQYLQSSDDRYYISRGPKSYDSYVYLTQAEDGVGVYIHSMSYASSDVRLGIWTGGTCNGPIWYYFNRYADTEFVWYIVPNEFGDKQGFQILNKYPAEGACAISKVSGAGLSEISGGFGEITDYKNTAWEFIQEDVNHEDIFKNNLDPYINLLKSYKDNQPWLQHKLNTAIDYLSGINMYDFGEESFSAVAKLNDYMYNLLNEFEEDLELEPAEHAVSIANVLRSGANLPSYLSAINGTVNTSDTVDENSTWTLEYYNNGRYNLVNDKGLYIGDLSDEIKVTSDPDLAGHYQICLYAGYVCLADRNDPTERVINVGKDAKSAKVSQQKEEGSLWIVKTIRKSSIEIIESTGIVNDSATEYYNLRGIKVNASSLTRGIYLMRQGSTVNKIIVK